MRKLGAVLEATTNAPHLLINRFAELLTVAIPTRGAAVAAEGTRGEYGDQIAEPYLREATMRHDHPVGEILLGPPQAEGYSGADIDRLRHYAELFGHILHAAKRHHHWQHLALTDDLAALPNRRCLLQFVDRILERAAVQRFRVTLCMFDIDNFKQYNDEFGHAAGDEIIRAMGQLLRQHCRAEDMVARYGGDEFVVALWDAEGPRHEGSEHPEQAIEFMKRFQAALRQHRFEHLGPRAQGELTVSGGLASYPWDASTTHALLDRANRALRDAKHQGKNRIHLVGTEVPRSA
jgi:diguanylate cyclase (GGDEF)-like protein